MERLILDLSDVVWNILVVLCKSVSDIRMHLLIYNIIWPKLNLVIVPSHSYIIDVLTTLPIRYTSSFDYTHAPSIIRLEYHDAVVMFVKKVLLANYLFSHLDFNVS